MIMIMIMISMALLDPTKDNTEVVCLISDVFFLNGVDNNMDMLHSVLRAFCGVEFQCVDMMTMDGEENDYSLPRMVCKGESVLDRFSQLVCGENQAEPSGHCQTPRTIQKM